MGESGWCATSTWRGTREGSGGEVSLLGLVLPGGTAESSGIGERSGIFDRRGLEREERSVLMVLRRD